jgi:outer membrane protein assembly factor BamE (lipoprotein component of BamABCDE complex)
MIVKKIFSILFLLLTLSIMFIIYFFMKMEIDFLVPNIFSVLGLIIPIVLVSLSVWFILDTFNINHKIRRIITQICLLLMLIPSIYFITNMYCAYTNSIFNSKQWINNPNKRIYMVDDMLQRYKLIGMSKNDIKRLLGTPSTTEKLKTSSNQVYYLGAERAFISIDDERLIVQFDKNDKVKGYRIVSD